MWPGNELIAPSLWHFLNFPTKCRGPGVPQTSCKIAPTPNRSRETFNLNFIPTEPETFLPKPWIALSWTIFHFSTISAKGLLFCFMLNVGIWHKFKLKMKTFSIQHTSSWMDIFMGNFSPRRFNGTDTKASWLFWVTSKLCHVRIFYFFPSSTHVHSM